jgi:hypothetical protein
MDRVSTVATASSCSNHCGTFAIGFMDTPASGVKVRLAALAPFAGIDDVGIDSRRLGLILIGAGTVGGH